MKKLENKSVIITAAGQGIGKETAIHFFKEGANVIATDINRTNKLEELSKEYEGKAVVGKMNVDMNSEVPMEYGIRGIPTILFFKGGKLVDKQVGVVPKSVLEEKLKMHL